MSVDIIDFDSLKKALPDRTLDKTRIDANLIKASLKKSPFSIDAVNLGFAAEAALDVASFNDAADADDDAVIASGGDAAIPFDAQKAWLRYRFSGLLSADAKASLNAAKIAFDASRRIVLSDYRVHARDKKTIETIYADLSSPRTIFNLEQVVALQPGEALRLAIRGTLGASLTLSWSDVFTRTLSLVESTTPIAIKLDASASVSFAVAVTDDFSLVIARAADGYRVSVKKDDTTSRKAGAKVGIEVTFVDPEAVKKKLEELVDNAKLRSELVKKLSALATQTVKLGFQYEYSKIDETVVFLQATLDEAALRRLHPRLVRADVAPALKAVHDHAPGIRLTKYLNETNVTRSRAWGFSLGLGKFVVSEQDQDEDKRVTRRDLDGRLAMKAFFRTRGYKTGKIWTNIQSSVAELKAEMDKFVENPATSDFDFGMHLLIAKHPVALKEAAVAEILDDAILWRIIAPDDAARVRDEIAAAGITHASATMQLTFTESVLARILGGVRDRAQMGRALGAAMPFDADGGRSSVASRAQIYGPLWTKVLEDEPNVSIADWEVRIRGHAGPLANFDVRRDDLRAFAGLRIGHPDLVRKWNAFRDGAENLERAIASRLDPDETIPAIYDKLAGFTDQALCLRALGHHLTDVAAQHGALGDVTRSLRLDYGKDQALIIA